MNETTADAGRPPPLREEVHLFPGPTARDGSPTWTLRDPATNQFFRLGWREFEILCRWRRGGPARIAELVSEETMIDTTPADVSELIRFLLGANLLRPQGEGGVARMQRHVEAGKRSWFQHILHAYLFFRIPLVDPERWLKKSLPWVEWLFSEAFFLASALAGLIGLHAISRQWEVAIATLAETDWMTEALFIALAMALTKAIHELGHAYAAIRAGCRVPTIGVAFLMMLPVLYTDTSEVWQLASRRKRLLVASAGILAELILTAWAALLWGVLPTGATKDALFFIATVSWISTLLMNASPFLRFDGYYLLSDWLDIENLHERAGRLGRWKLREWLWGLNAPFPDAALHDRRNFLILFAWVTWVYRFFLYLGIALTVYHLFFKLLGMLLMSVEIGWFLVRPIWEEFSIWRRPETRIRLNRRTLFTLGLFITLIAATLIPWKGTIQAPALLQRAGHTTLHAPSAARVVERRVEEGDTVESGQVLLRLESPDLLNQLEIARQKIDLARWKSDFRGGTPNLLKRSLINDRELEVELTRQRELQRQEKQLTLTAPFSGRIVRFDRMLAPGLWVAHGEPLLEVTQPNAWQVTAYVREIDLPRISTGSHGIFLSEGIDWPALPGTITDIAPVGSSAIEELALFSQHGGNVPVKRDPQGQWLPTTALYRLVWRPESLPAPLPHTLRGTLFLENQRAENLLTRFQRLALEVLIRETGF
ncbi:MAG: HlyD family efflux transporter periplasmic adaptor subunit [Magnetococcus sp. YQC-9]